MFRKRKDDPHRRADKTHRRAAAEHIDEIMRERAAQGERAFAEEIERRRAQTSDRDGPDAASAAASAG
jgi:hypothetical protein